MRGLGLLLGIAQAAIATKPRYVRDFSYVKEDFFSHWHFDAIKDPTHGFVTYVDFETARREGLVNATADRVFMGADRKTVSRTKGRKSVRIVSKAVYNRGLFIVTMDHMPTGCGMWPALWMLGMNKDLVRWPTWGEYDIIEGVHRTSRSFTSLHTNRGCDQSSLVPGKDFTSKWGLGSTKKADNCDINAPGQWRNQGCSQEAPPASMGPEFNANKGGTYAAEWDPEGGFLRAWFWTAGSEPSDVAKRSPDPESWGTPYSNFVFSPDICPKEKVQNMHIIYDLTFCGDLGGMMYRPMCPQFAARATCEEHVGTNLDEMAEAYWSIRAMDVYQRKAEQSEEARRPQAGATETVVREQGEPEDGALAGVRPRPGGSEEPKAPQPADAEAPKLADAGEPKAPKLADAEEPKAPKPRDAEEPKAPRRGPAEAAKTEDSEKPKVVARAPASASNRPAAPPDLQKLRRRSGEAKHLEATENSTAAESEEARPEEPLVARSSAEVILKKFASSRGSVGGFFSRSCLTITSLTCAVAVACALAATACTVMRRRKGSARRASLERSSYCPAPHDVLEQSASARLVDGSAA